MELARSSESENGMLRGLGRCRHFFWLGVAFDAVGATVLIIGVVSDLIFYDLLLYLGSIIIFLSLLWWVFWYTGNIELNPEESWKRPTRLGAMNRHFTFSLNLNKTLARIRPGRHRRFLENTSSIRGRSFTIQVHNPLAEEDKDKDGRKGVRVSSETKDSGREDLGPEPEAVERSERVGPPDPEAGPLGSKARRTCGHLVQSKFIPSKVLDQSLFPAIVSSKSLSVVPSSSPSQSLTLSYSKSLPNSTGSENHPLITVTPVSLPGVPLSSSDQPLDILASDIETSGVSQNYPLMHVAEQRHFSTPVDSERHSLASRNQASQTEALIPQGSLIHLTPGTQTVHPWLTVAGQNFQAQYDNQQVSTNTIVVQESELSRSSHSQEPPGGQELSQEVPDTISRLPESVAPATEAQKSVPHESVPAPNIRNSRHL